MNLYPPNVPHTGTLPPITRKERHAMKLIKVNGLTIVPEHVAMLERKSGKRFDDDMQDITDYAGINIYFTGGGRKWVYEPTASMIEAAFENYDRSDELPY
jgi:hypothetical protein